MIFWIFANLGLSILGNIIFIPLFFIIRPLRRLNNKKGENFLIILNIILIFYIIFMFWMYKNYDWYNFIKFTIIEFSNTNSYLYIFMCITVYPLFSFCISIWTF